MSFMPTSVHSEMLSQITISRFSNLNRRKTILMGRDVVIRDTIISKCPAEVYIHDTGAHGPMEGGFVGLVLNRRSY